VWGRRQFAIPVIPITNVFAPAQFLPFISRMQSVVWYQIITDEYYNIAKNLTLSSCSVFVAVGSTVFLLASIS
jgi:hypothetical protein